VRQAVLDESVRRYQGYPKSPWSEAGKPRSGDAQTTVASKDDGHECEQQANQDGL
jgi:hypothetical protein